MSDATRFDFCIEVGQRIVYMGSAKLIENFNELLRKNIPNIPTDSALMLLMDQERFTGVNEPPDMEVVAKFVRLMTSEPGKFTTFDDARKALELGLVMVGAWWEQYEEESQRNSNTYTLLGVMSLAVIIGALTPGVSPWILLNLIPLATAWFGVLSRKMDDSAITEPVFKAITDMLDQGAEHTRVL